jgi:hypothetical protein
VKTLQFKINLARGMGLSVLERVRETAQEEASANLKQKVRLMAGVNQIRHEPDCRQASFTNYQDVMV